MERSYLETQRPAAGIGWWYVLRGISCAGAGTYDGPLTGQSGRRDTEINNSTNACP